MPKGERCLFCSVQEEDDRAAGILKRGNHWFVLLNMFPYTNGHLMVVAARHIERIRDIREDEAGELVEFLSLSELALDKAYHPDGINIGVNRGASAGAGVVGHLHFHLVPRWNGDTNFMTAVAETRVVSEDFEESLRKLEPHFR